jgi:hypothetical protein
VEAPLAPPLLVTIIGGSGGNRYGLAYHNNDTVLNVKMYVGGRCLLPFSPEPSVFPSVDLKSKNENIQDYNFACGFLWVQNLVSGTKGGT